MEFNFIGEGIDAVIVDNFYSDTQLKEIHEQLKSLTNEHHMSADRDKLEAAVDLDGNFITAKYGVWSNDPTDPLVKYSNENFSNLEMIEKLTEFNSMYRMFFYMNRRSYLISYYENTGYYSKHVDASVFTILNYFHQEPKCFKGGDIVLHSHNMKRKATIETKDNRVVIVPSCTLHEVMPVEMTSHKLDGTGRYCCSIFASIDYINQKKES